MADSEAFYTLSSNGKTLLIYALMKRKWMRTSSKKGGKKKTEYIKDHFEMTYRDLEKKYKLKNSQISRALDELLARGFFKFIHQGGYCKGNKAIYELDDKWQFWNKGVVFSKRDKIFNRGFQKKLDERSNKKEVDE